MNFFKTSLLLLIVLIVSSPGLAKVLDVPQVYQEETEWCWAGVSQSVLEYYGEFYNQTQIAEYGTEGVNTWNWLWGSSSDPTRRGIDLILDHFADISSTPTAMGIDLYELDNNVNDDKPVIIRWSWDSGGGHFVTVAGVESDMIHIVDPLYGPSVNTYSWVKNGSGHTWTHTLEMVTRPPILNIIPAGLYFLAEKNDLEILSEKLEITNSGDRNFYWFVNTDVSWLSIEPKSGYPPVDIEVHADPSSLSIGTYTASITVMALGAQNSPAIIPLTLEIRKCINGLDKDSDIDGVDLAILVDNIIYGDDQLGIIASRFGSLDCNYFE